MNYVSKYSSPLGEILLGSDGTALTGLWFAEQKYFAENGVGMVEDAEEKDDLEIFQLTRKWLDIYFEGKEPDFMPPVRLEGSEFRQKVWQKLQEIPYGELTTYGEIAKSFGRRMSAQAVGGAVGHNPVSIIVPCHRVVGADSSLTGYAGGLGIKVQLLGLEGHARGVR